MANKKTARIGLTQVHFGKSVTIDLTAVPFTLSASMDAFLPSENIYGEPFSLTSTIDVIVPLNYVFEPVTFTPYFSLNSDEIENRFLSEPFMVIGHSDADLSLLYNGYVKTLTVKVTVGAPTQLLISYSDSITFTDIGLKQQEANVNQPSTFTDTYIAILHPPPYDFYDSLTGEDTGEVEGGADVNVTDTLTASDAIINIVVTDYRADSLAGTDAIIQMFDYLKEYGDHLTFGYELCGADIQNELSGYNAVLTASDSAHPQAESDTSDTLTSEDSVEPEHERVDVDEDAITFDDQAYKEQDRVDVDDTAITFGEDNVATGGYYEDTDSLSGTDEYDYDVNYGEVYNDTITFAVDEVIYTEESLVSFNDSLTATDKQEYGGDFNFYTNITFGTDIANKQQENESSDTLVYDDGYNFIVQIFDSLDATDAYIVDFQVTYGDSLQGSDVWFSADYPVSFDDTITGTEILGKEVLDERTDTLNGTDIGHVGLPYDVDDTLTSEDSLLNIYYFMDTITSTEEIEASFLKVLSDTITGTDGLKELYVFVFDSPITFSDIVRKEADAQETSDSIYSSEDLSTIVDLYDSLSGTDEIINVVIQKSYTDTLRATDTKQYGGDFLVTVTDTSLSLFDIAVKGLSASVDASITLTDERVDLVFVYDTLSFGADVLTSDFQRTVSDTLTGTDRISNIGGYISVEVSDSLYSSDIVKEGKVVDVSFTLTAQDEQEFLVFIYDSIYCGEETVVNSITKGIFDTITFSETKIFTGSMTAIYSETSLTLSDIVKRDVNSTQTDTLYLRDIPENMVEYSDSINFRSDNIYIDFLRRCSDSISFYPDSILRAGSMTVNYYDSLYSFIDYQERGIQISKDDLITISDNFSKIVAYTDTLTFEDSKVIDWTHTESFADTITLRHAFNSGGEMLLNYSDSLTARDLLRQGGNTETSDTVQLNEFSMPEVLSTPEVEIVSEDIYSGDYPYDMNDEVTFVDEFTFTKVTWLYFFVEDMEWVSYSYPDLLFVDEFEVTRPTTTSLILFRDMFEWFVPHYTPSWASILSDDFEIVPIHYTPLFIDAFEYAPQQIWDILFIDEFEEFAPYRTIELTNKLFGDDFEYEEAVTYTPLFSADFEIEPINWSIIPMYRYDDPINPVVWASDGIYIDEDPINPAVWSLPIYDSGFEVSSEAVWVQTFTDRFEVINPVVWESIPLYVEDIEYAPIVSWGVLFNDDLEPFKYYRTNIRVGAENTAKRLDVLVDGKYGNLVYYDWLEEDPLPYYLLSHNIETIPSTDVVLHNRIWAYGMTTKYFNVNAEWAYGGVAFGFRSHMLFWKEYRHRLRTNISYCQYLFKFLRTEVPLGLVTTQKLHSHIPATIKEVGTRVYPSNISIAIWKLWLWRHNIVTAGNVTAQKLSNHLLAYKAVNYKLRNNIKSAFLFSLALPTWRNVNIITSYADTQLVIVTELAAPTRETYQKVRTNTRSAWGITKYRNSNIRASYSAFWQERTNIRAREGEAVGRLRSHIHATSVSTNRQLHVNFSASYRNILKPFIRTYIGGYPELPFYKEVVMRLRTNIKCVGEYFWQYQPCNNRRTTNIVAGSDPNHPFIIVEKLPTRITVSKSITRTLRTSIRIDYATVKERVCFTNIYALRCPTCMKNSIIVSYKNYQDTNIWAAYGRGSTGYIDMKYRLNVRGLRVPQGYYFTHIQLGSKETTRKNYSLNIRGWFGPTYTNKIRIWDTSIVMTKLVVSKLRTRISVGRQTTKVQTVTNIWSQKGEYKYLRTLINAPMALRIAYYNTEIFSAFTGYIALNSNIWVSTADNQRFTYGVAEPAYTLNFEAFRQMSVLGYRSNIKCIGELLKFISCGIFHISPPLVTELYGAKTIFEPVFYTRLDLVEIVSRCTLVDSAVSLAESFEYFEEFRGAFVKHTLFNAELFNNWVGFRYRILLAYNENYNSYPKHTHLHFKKTINDMNQEKIHTERYVQRVNTEFNLLSYTYTIRTHLDMEVELIASYYFTNNGDNMIDVEFTDSITEKDWYFSPLVILNENMTIRDSYFSNFLVLFESLKLKDYADYPIIVRDTLTFGVDRIKYTKVSMWVPITALDMRGEGTTTKPLTYSYSIVPIMTETIALTCVVKECLVYMYEEVGTTPITYEIAPEASEDFAIPYGSYEISLLYGYDFENIPITTYSISLAENVEFEVSYSYDITMEWTEIFSPITFSYKIVQKASEPFIAGYSYSYEIVQAVSEPLTCDFYRIVNKTIDEGMTVSYKYNMQTLVSENLNFTYRYEVFTLYNVVIEGTQ